ncbi:uncharacterized protein LOC112090220 [Eutrema salsugineum]|uniref:uncharacterized protein LOC112090220 n=1 Tax=Eutrema salsugineum TaxID=72664 RepID=UPI000CED5323|nr:uncharacterized protein LOC112090220 [Eutrema salsugineum]
MGNDEGVNLSRENEENGGDQDDISKTYGMLDIVDPPDCVEEQRIQREWADGLKLRVGAEFSSETGCNWYINTAKTAQSHIFTVRVYRKMHSCSRASACTSSKRKKCTPGLVAGVVSKTYPGRLKPPPPRDIMALVQTRGRVKVSYSTTWRGRQKAISYVRGTPEESFEHLHSYLYMIEQFNPGTTSSVEVDELGRFKYLFVALGPTIEGFAAMRKVIIVDATFLKNGFGGCLVFATTQDPNHHHYLLSFGVVDGENNDSWNWFFTKLKTRIPDSSELVFVSDRNNVKKNVRREKELVVGKFMEVARKYTKAEFLVAYGQLEEKYPDAITYLCNSLLEEKWARCYFPGERYNIDTSNYVESMNSVFDYARKHALLPMMDAILSKSLNVTELNSFLLKYAVVSGDGKTYLMNLKTKSCSCRWFDIDKYPCVHALAAVRIFMAREDRSEDIHSYDLCSKYYTTELWALAYARTIYPVPHRSQWVIPDDIEKKTAPKPPEVPKKAGRRQQRRLASVGERGPRPSNKRKKRQGNTEDGVRNANGNTQGNEGRDPNFNASNPEGNAHGNTHGGGWWQYFNASNPEGNTQGGSSTQDR